MWNYTKLAFEIGQYDCQVVSLISRAQSSHTWTFIPMIAVQCIGKQQSILFGEMKAQRLDSRAERGFQNTFSEVVYQIAVSP